MTDTADATPSSFQHVNEPMQALMGLVSVSHLPIGSIFTAIRNRLRAPDTLNKHEPIALRGHTFKPDSFEASFMNPADGKTYLLIVVRDA